MEEREPKSRDVPFYQIPQHNTTTTTTTADDARLAQHRNLPRNHRPMSIGLEAIDDDLLNVHG